MEMEHKRKQNRYFMPLNLQLFADGDPEPEPNPEPTPKTVTMTQDELDSLIGREKAKARKPYADYDEVKSKLAEYETEAEQRRLAALSESERVAAELEAARKKAEEAEGKSAATLKAANERLIKAEFKVAAAAANIRPEALEDAYLLANKSGVSVGDDGSVSGISEAITSLVSSKPYLVAEPKQPQPIGGPGNPKPDERKTLEAALEEARKQKNVAKVVELSNKLGSLK